MHGLDVEGCEEKVWGEEVLVLLWIGEGEVGWVDEMEKEERWD